MASGDPLAVRAVLGWGLDFAPEAAQRHEKARTPPLACFGVPDGSECLLAAWKNWATKAEELPSDSRPMTALLRSYVDPLVTPGGGASSPPRQSRSGQPPWPPACGSDQSLRTQMGHPTAP